MTQIDNAITVILEKFPFLSYGSFCDDHYLGIIQNADNQLVSLYDLNAMPQEIRNRFLVMGEQWWWESNRQIPIHIFMKDRFRIFRPYLKHFSRKEFNIKAGPSVSLQETIARRVRKRQITLLRKID